MSGFKVINAGIMTQVQDLGRFGFTKVGIANSGASDVYAYNIANMLLGNPLNTNALEISFSNLTLQAQEQTVISITGANLSLHINEQLVTPWQTYKINKNDILKFRKKISGQKAYLAVAGGFKLEKELNSFSTTIKEELGTVLQNGMDLEFEKQDFFKTQRLKSELIPNYDEPLVLRVVLGYQEDFFQKEQKDKFFNTTFEVSNEASRMGTKIDGEKIVCDIDGIISEGIAFGAIQIPKDGRPIVLLKERQTIGGYPKIGSVLSIDCFKLSQAKAGTKIVFKEISLPEAAGKLREFYSIFKQETFY